MGFLSGGSKSESRSTQRSESTSQNRAFPQVQQSLNPSINQGVQANTAIGNLLGLNGQQGFDEGFQNYLDSSGYNFVLNNGLDAVLNNSAASGLLNSGATAKRLEGFRSDINQNFFGSYLDRLFGLNSTGNNAANIVTGAGGISNSSSIGNSNSTSSSNPGFSGAIGSIGAAIAGSDIQLKIDIEQVGSLEDGLGVYNFRYRGDTSNTLYKGVMAQDVERLRPEALGPVVEGFMTVDYSQIPELGQMEIA